MAREIATYEAKDLKLNPSNTGYSAAEQAARRIGPFANQAAQAVRQVSELQAKSLENEGQQQTAFARLYGLEAEKNKGAGGEAVKTSHGPMDMFRLGMGGREPNLARLNTSESSPGPKTSGPMGPHALEEERMKRLAELSEGPARISRAARDIVNAQSPLTNTAQNGVTILRGGQGNGQSDVENGTTVLRGGGGVPPDRYHDPTVDLLGQPYETYRPPGSYNTNVIQGGPEGFGTGKDGTFNQFHGGLAPVPIGGGGEGPASDVTSERLNENQWPQGTPLPANNGVFGTTYGADNSVNNTLPGQQATVVPAPGSSQVSAPPDPSQAPDAPPIYDQLMGGF